MPGLSWWLRGAAGVLLAMGVAGSVRGDDAHAMARRLGRGVNLGNALEAPAEGEWGVTLRREYFDAIAEAGFDSVRVPIKWSAHAAKESPYTIDPALFERVDGIVGMSMARGLATVINVHHYDELNDDPAAHKDRFVAIWRQVAERYRACAPDLCFELLNEPHGNLTKDVWHGMIPDGLAAIRATNPTRTVVVGSGDWNTFGLIPKLPLPADDRNLIVTFHYYSPFHFTHQGAEWVTGTDTKSWLGTTWTGTDEQQAAIRSDFDVVAQWATANDRPVYVGEFGAYGKADMASRARWTAFVAREAEARGFAWSYWEFCSGFGAYDAEKGKYREELKKALLPE